MRTVATVGYEGTSLPDLIHALTEAEVSLLVDVRAVANSRRPGFSKKSLSASVEAAGIEYLHMRDLGTPSDGRVAARAGRHETMHRIYREHLATPEAQFELEVLAQLVHSARRVCLLCYEAKPDNCHRRLITNALAEFEPISVLDLRPEQQVD